MISHILSWSFIFFHDFSYSFMICHILSWFFMVQVHKCCPVARGKAFHSTLCVFGLAFTAIWPAIAGASDANKVHRSSPSIAMKSHEMPHFGWSMMILTPPVGSSVRWYNIYVILIHIIIMSNYSRISATGSPDKLPPGGAWEAPAAFCCRKGARHWARPSRSEVCCTSSPRRPFSREHSNLKPVTSSDKSDNDNGH